MVYKPVFKITPQLANLLNKIAVLREKILSLTILPQRESKLRQLARLRSIHSSTSIEGNPLGIHDVKVVLARKIVTGISEKDRLEVVNYEKVLKFIDKQATKQTKINWERIILKMHRLITKDILPEKKRGKYRTGPVYVVEQPSQEIIYEAPTASQVKKLMQDFSSWFESYKAQELSPVIISAIAHHQLVTIHPFTDGNGRTARALATFILYQMGFDIKKLFTLDDYYNRNRSLYYQAIQETRNKKDLTSWLEYFAEGLLSELNFVLEKVQHFSREVKSGQEQLYISKRQREILDFIAINGKIFRSDVVTIASVSPKTAYRELESLRRLELIKRRGKGPKTYYILV